MGLKKEDLMKHSSYAKDEEGWESLLDGENDLDASLEEWLIKQGWCKISIEEKDQSIDANTPENLRKAVAYTQHRVKRTERVYYTVYSKAQSAGLTRHGTLQGTDTINTFIKTGKKPERSEIGSTMAMFR